MKTKKAFKRKQKAFVITFKGLSVAKNRLRSESPPLRNKMLKLKESFRSTDNGKMVCLMFFFSLWNKISKDLNVIIINVSITVSWFYTFSFDFLSKSKECFLDFLWSFCQISILTKYSYQLPFIQKQFGLISICWNKLTFLRTYLLTDLLSDPPILENNKHF